MKKYQLPLTTMIDVFAIKDDRIVKKTMTYEKALKLLEKPSKWRYDFYEVDFCSIKPTE